MTDNSQIDPQAEDNLRSSDFIITLNTVKLADPFRWLSLGIRDFFRAPLIGLFFGACFVGMGWALLKAFESSPSVLLGLSAGFLLVGPFFCMGLYKVSQRLEHGESPGMEEAVFAWTSKFGTLAIFGVILLVLEMLWARASLVVFAIAIEGPLPDIGGSIMGLFKPENMDFVLAWLGLGGIFASIVFSVCVVSIPMILDKGVDAILAGLTSIRLVLEQTFVLIVWGAIITVLVVLAMAPWFMGLLVVGPILGHATWHAYRGAVHIEIKPRDQQSEAG